VKGGARADVVVTEEDYIQFLTVVNDPVKGVPNFIGGKLTTSTLLFLGYSLEDWDFRTLYKTLVEQRPSKLERRVAFAVQWDPPDFWVEYWRPKGVRIIDWDVYEFADELERRYVAKYGSLDACARTPATKG
jgi:hypothetical protein